VYVKTEVAPKADISVNSRFYVLVMDKNSIEEQKALQYLAVKLKNAGYKVVTSINDMDYYFAISMDTPSYSSTYSMPITTPSTTNYGGYVGNTYYSGTSTSYQTSYVPVTNTYSFKKNYLNLFKYNKKTGKSRLIWSSFTSIDSKKYNKYEQQIMNIVVSLLGKGFEGRVKLK